MESVKKCHDGQGLFSDLTQLVCRECADPIIHGAVALIIYDHSFSRVAPRAALSFFLSTHSLFKPSFSRDYTSAAEWCGWSFVIIIFLDYEQENNKS